MYHQIYCLTFKPTRRLKFKAGVAFCRRRLVNEFVRSSLSARTDTCRCSTYILILKILEAVVKNQKTRASILTTNC